MAPLIATPKYTDLVKVHYSDSTSFDSSLLAVRDFPASSTIAILVEGTKEARKRYTSVQYSKGEHFELNNEFVYMNHSCRPSARIEVSDPTRVEVIALRDIRAGEAVTFNYLTTEWDMDQPFECNCREPDCFGTIRGAKYAVRALKDRKVSVNPHIQLLMQEALDEPAS